MARSQKPTFSGGSKQALSPGTGKGDSLTVRGSNAKNKRGPNNPNYSGSTGVVLNPTKVA